MWRTILGGAVVVAIALAATTTGHSQTGRVTDPTPCRLAHALYAAREVNKARAEYVAVLRRNPRARCAINRLREINAPKPAKTTPSCREADETFDAGRLDDARAKYRRIGADTECAAAGLKAIREVLTLCSLGRQQLANHDKKAARATFDRALAATPAAKCAKDGATAAGTPWPVRWLNAGIDNVPEAIAVLGALALLYLLALLLAHFERCRGAMARVWPASRILAPRLTLAAFDDAALGDDKVGPAVLARIRERLQRFSDEAKSDDSVEDVDFGTGADDFAVIVSGDGRLQGALDKVGEASEHAKLVTAFIDLVYALLPIRRLSVTGVLEPSDTATVGATLILDMDSRPVAATTLSVSAPSASAKNYLRLGQPAAVWVQYEVARAIARQEVQPNAAESYARVREGLALQDEGKHLEAQAAYELAVALNPRNWAARVNLAMAEAQLQGNYDGAVAILSDAYYDITEEPGDAG